MRSARRGFAAVGILLAALTLTGCVAAQTETASQTAIGAFAGTTPAPASTAALLEALGDGLIGREIGSELRREERRSALAAEYQALEYAQVGEQVIWRGSSDRLVGEVTAAAPYRVGSQNCRQYVHTVRSGETSRTARGTACREPDGRWSLLI
ncbi:hypothetical protein [Chelativorans sp. ZYF759]|uniref:hypothetical protein n=1 Tax=Chelativorans sp. ZYF759 TaxID=2692213 RepID=UPI001AED21FB|nr:hypothetical protein [Chelativorans sp. ZYF759]